MKGGTPYRPPGSLCVHCVYRSAVIHPRVGKAGLYCSPRCRTAAHSNTAAARKTVAANKLRALLGLPSGGSTFTACELEAMARRAQRIVPPGGMNRMPAGRRSPKRVA